MCVHSHIRRLGGGACLCRTCAPGSKAVCLGVFSWLYKWGGGSIAKPPPPQLFAVSVTVTPTCWEHLQGLVLPGLFYGPALAGTRGALRMPGVSLP